MFILVPVDSANATHSKITTLGNIKKWALIDFDDGKVKSTRFFDDRTLTGEDWIDFCILENKFEDYADFMNDGMMVLVRREEETLEEIISAFRFKELDEI